MECANDNGESHKYYKYLVVVLISISTFILFLTLTGVLIHAGLIDLSRPFR